MEDTQPNEVRLSRNIPRVRTTRPIHNPYPSNRVVVIHLPRECHKGAPGGYNARKRWIEDQKHHLKTDRHLSVVSFRLNHDNTVRFECRAQQATRSTGHHARDGTGPHLVDAHLNTKNTSFTPQAPSTGSHSGFAQSSEPPSSRIRPISPALARLGGCLQRLGNQSSIPSSILRKPVESSTTEIKSRPVQIVHANPIPRPRTVAHTATPTESVIDLTLDHSSPVAEEHSARWSTFRSGYVDISLPPFSSGSRVSSPDASTDQQPPIDQAPGQAVGQRQDMSFVRSSDPSPHSAHPNIRATDTVPMHSVKAHRVGGALADQHRQHDALEAAPSNYPRSIAPEDEAVAPSSPSDYSPLIRGFTSACGILPLSLGPHDRPRRILHDRDFTYVVTAHGVIDQLGTTSVLELDRNIRSPSLPFEEFVDDACILSHQGNPVVILGHAREQNQIACLVLGHGQVSRHITLRRDTVKRHGVSAMTSLMSPLKFASGGYDHRVHLWDIAQDLSGASAVELAIKHTSLVHSLLPIVDTSHKLVSVGADCDVPIYDMSSERVVQTLKTSCIPYHAHKTDLRSCTLLEVSHLETQFEIRDHRQPNQAVQRFGFLAGEKRGRFEKADSWSHFVVYGDRDGAVRLWDLRNVSTEVAYRQCFNDPVVQVVNTGPRLLACSKRNELACINFQDE